MAYVYRHIRLDKNEVFYVGIGTDKYFFRAKDKKRRNRYWNNITKVSNWYHEIVFISDSIDVVKQKEIELIESFGRICDGGTLCNVTKGGEGKLGVKPPNVRPCYGISPAGEKINFRSILDAARYLQDENCAPNIGRICKNIESSLPGNRTCKGWYFAYEGSKIDGYISQRGKIKNKPSKFSQKIWGKSPNGEILEFENAYRAAEFIDSHHTLVRKVCKGKSSHTKNWKFSYDPM